MNTKICNECNLEKPLSEFHKNKNAPDGFQYKCKDCIKKYQMSKSFTNNVDEIKTCPNCGESKISSEFYHNKRKPDGLSSWCKNCILRHGKPIWERGYVYFIRGSDKVKIGFTSDKPVKRIKSLQTGSPVKLSLIGYIFDDNACQLETELHHNFEKYHSHGEWYFYSDEIRQYIIHNIDDNTD